MISEVKAAQQRVDQLTAQAKKTPTFLLKPVLQELADAQAHFNALVAEALAKLY